MFPPNYEVIEYTATPNLRCLLLILEASSYSFPFDDFFV